MKTPTFITVLGFLSVFSFISCNSGHQQNSTTEPASNLEPVEIGYSQLRISIPIFVAQEEGIFKKHGLDAKLTMYTTAQPLMQAMIEGKLNVGGYTALPISYTAMAKSGKQLYFISAMIEDKQHRISFLLRRKTPDGQTPSIKSIKDLKGKKIGILPTVAYKGWLEEILRKNGLNPEKDVVIQQIAPELEGQTLKAGGIDALFTNDPVATATLNKGITELITNDVECPNYIRDPFLFGSFNVRKEWADKNPSTFKKLTEAINEAIDSADANPVKAKLSLKKYLPDAFKEQALKYPDALYWNTAKAGERSFIEIDSIYLKLGVIPQKVNLTGLIVK